MFLLVDNYGRKSEPLDDSSYINSLFMKFRREFDYQKDDYISVVDCFIRPEYSPLQECSRYVLKPNEKGKLVWDLIMKEDIYMDSPSLFQIKFDPIKSIFYVTELKIQERQLGVSFLTVITPKNKEIIVSQSIISDPFTLRHAYQDTYYVYSYGEVEDAIKFMSIGLEPFLNKLKLALIDLSEQLENPINKLISSYSTYEESFAEFFKKESFLSANYFTLTHAIYTSSFNYEIQKSIHLTHVSLINPERIVIADVDEDFLYDYKFVEDYKIFKNGVIRESSENNSPSVFINHYHVPLEGILSQKDMNKAIENTLSFIREDQLSLHSSMNKTLLDLKEVSYKNISQELLD